MLLNEVFKEYIEDIEIDIKLTSIDNLRYRYANRIEKQLGYLEVEKITYVEVKKYQKQLIEKELLSVSYVNAIIGLIKRIVKFAYLQRYVEKNELDILKQIKDNKVLKDEQVIWNLKEFENFIANVDKEKYKILFNILFFCGLRKGEVLSLKWNNINFEERYIKINSTAAKVIGKGQLVTPPKTSQSNRIIYMNDTLYDMLLEYYFNIKQQYQMVDNYFIIGNSKMMSLSTLDRNYGTYRKKSGCTQMNLHGFRHSHASMLITLTTDIQAISARLGHANVEETMNTYLHTNTANQKALARAVEDNLKISITANTMTSTIENIKKTLLKELENFHTKEENEKLINAFKFMNGDMQLEKIILANT